MNEQIEKRPIDLLLEGLSDFNVNRLIALSTNKGGICCIDVLEANVFEFKESVK